MGTLHEPYWDTSTAEVIPPAKNKHCCISPDKGKTTIFLRSTAPVKLYQRRENLFSTFHNSVFSVVLSSYHKQDISPFFKHRCHFLLSYKYSLMNIHDVFQKVFCTDLKIMF